jgi:hypothetical protein
MGLWYLEWHVIGKYVAKERICEYESQARFEKGFGFWGVMSRAYISWKAPKIQ